VLHDIFPRLLEKMGRTEILKCAQSLNELQHNYFTKKTCSLFQHLHAAKIVSCNVNNTVVFGVIITADREFHQFNVGALLVTVGCGCKCLILYCVCFTTLLLTVCGFCHLLQVACDVLMLIMTTTIVVTMIMTSMITMTMISMVMIVYTEIIFQTVITNGGF
jgi:hypothetical protein